MNKDEMKELANKILSDFLYNNPGKAPKLRWIEKGSYSPFDELNSSSSIIIEYTRGRKRLIKDYEGDNIYPQYSLIRSTGIRSSHEPLRWFRHNGVSVGTININKAEVIEIKENLLIIDNFTINLEIRDSLAESHTLELIRAEEPKLDDKHFNNVVEGHNLNKYNVRDLASAIINEYKRLML